MTETITSPNNTLVKLARSLRQRKARLESGLFLVEGILHVGEVVAAGWDLDCLLYAPEVLKSDFAASLITQQQARGIRCQPVSMPVLETATQKDNPQGILALVRQQHSSLEELDQGKFAAGLALVSPQDPGNVGATLRTLDAAGGDALFLLDGGADPFQPAAVRASMGALFWKPVVQTSFEALTSWARAGSVRLVGSSARGKVGYRDVDVSAGSWILLMGSEQKGLSEEQAAACDLLVRIPMRGRTSSLNLAVAAGILLYALTDG